MKRFKLRTLVAAFLAIAILGGLFTVFSLAESNLPTVTFDYRQKKFLFENVMPQAGNLYPDLFTDFKDMMPGDSRSQPIRVKVKNLEDGFIYLYLRTEPVWPDNPDEITAADASDWRQLTDAALSQMKLVVRHDGEDLTQAALAEGVFLGKFLHDGVVDLDVALEIPIEAGNELQALHGEIGWVFTAEYHADDSDPDLPVDPGNPDGPGGGGGGDDPDPDLPIDPGNPDGPGGGGDDPDIPFNPDDPDAPIDPPGGGGGDPDPDNPDRPALDKGDHYAYIIGYPDGLVHPELQITRAESTTIFFRMLLEESRAYYWSQVNPYFDVFPYDWYNNAISTMTNADIVEGYPDDSFRPNGNITRAEFAAMAVRFFTGEDVDVNDNVFPDVQDHWANYEINLAYAHDLIQGYPDGTFRPDQEITRAEAVTIVNRVLERHPHKEHLLEDMIVWPDNMDETMWYYEDIQEATNSHVFDRLYDEDNQPYEIWTELLPVRDWVALEQMWSDANSSYNPGEVVSSKNASIFK